MKSIFTKDGAMVTANNLISNEEVANLTYADYRQKMKELRDGKKSVKKTTPKVDIKK